PRQPGHHTMSNPERTEPSPADMKTLNTPADRETIDHPLVEREVARPMSAGTADTGLLAEHTALFEPDLLGDFNARWTDVQTSFVDEPRRAVEQADALVSDVIKRIADSFGRERA